MTISNYGDWKPCGVIANIQHRNDLILMTDSQDVTSVFEHLGKEMEGGEGVFVKAVDGEYVEVFKFYGIPYLYKPLWKLEIRE